MHRIEQLSEAVILCLGDCREELPGLPVADAVVTDPPYGINAKLGIGGGTKGDGGMWAGVRIAGDETTAVRDNVLTACGLPFAALAKWNTAAPPGTRCAVVWSKGEHTGAGDLSLPWKPDFEFVFIGGEGWSAPRRGSGVLKINAIAGCVADRNDGHRFHPFEKPVELMRHFCDRAPGKVICDPFMGSGTTGIAAIKSGRGFVGVEVDPGFFDTACRRISDALKRPELAFGSETQDVVRRDSSI